MLPKRLHPLQEAYYDKAPFILSNSVGERVLWFRRAVEILSKLPQDASFSDIWELFKKETRLKISIEGNYLWIPEDSPLIVTANHPYTLLDAISIGGIIEKRRKSAIRVLSDSPAGLMPEWDHLNIPLAKSFQESVEMQRKVDELLSSWGTLLMFPAGQTSYRNIITGTTQETQWKPWVLRFAQRAKTPILPVHVEVQTSELYNFLKNFFSREFVRNFNLREATRDNVSVRVTIGEVIQNTKHLSLDSLQKTIYKIWGKKFKVKN